MADEPEVKFDAQARAAYVYLPNHPRTRGSVAKTIEAGHGVLLDFDARGKLIGVEILLPERDA